ncbi:T9SS type A sorting domain-containing protein [Flavobacterium sp.]|jgi:hypothetical protein|uniref:T9SS type A sorting domain-containing protein n=1 Tax=Flavobacterium sp. TaxID=239 RepID=UPI0037BF7D84
MKIKKILFFSVIFTSNLLIAQNSITASGGNKVETNGAISYSVGEQVYVTNFASNGSVSQGVQQPYEISTVLSTNAAQGINLLLSILPNPTSDFITLKVENYDFESLNFQLVDLNGKLFFDGKTIIKETKIEIGNLPSSIYFLKVTDGTKELKTFKILKTN